VTGPEHYAEAQDFAGASVYAYQKWGETGDDRELKSALWKQGQAQVHATLAAAAATALGWCDSSQDQAWQDTAGSPRLREVTP
jgi:hypothetical protein